MKVNWHIWLYVGFAVVVTILLVNTFGSKGANEKQIRTEMKIEQVEQKRVSDSLLADEKLKNKDEIIAALKDNQQNLITKYEATKPVYRAIRPAVRDLSSDSLNAAIERFRPID